MKQLINFLRDPVILVPLVIVLWLVYGLIGGFDLWWIVVGLVASVVLSRIMRNAKNP